MNSNETSRQQLVQEGIQKDISETVKKGGLLIPTYVTKRVWDDVIKLDKSTEELSTEEDKRVHEVVDKLVYYMRVHRQSSKSNTINFNVSFKRHGQEQNYDLTSSINVLDNKTPQPCITIMMSDE